MSLAEENRASKGLDEDPGCDRFFTRCDPISASISTTLMSSVQLSSIFSLSVNQSVSDVITTTSADSTSSFS